MIMYPLVACFSVYLKLVLLVTAQEELAKFIILFINTVPKKKGPILTEEVSVIVHES